MSRRVLLQNRLDDAASHDHTLAVGCGRMVFSVNQSGRVQQHVSCEIMHHICLWIVTLPVHVVLMPYSNLPTDVSMSKLSSSSRLSLLAHSFSPLFVNCRACVPRVFRTCRLASNNAMMAELIDVPVPQNQEQIVEQFRTSPNAYRLF